MFWICLPHSHQKNTRKTECLIYNFRKSSYCQPQHIKQWLTQIDEIKIIPFVIITFIFFFNECFSFLDGNGVISYTSMLPISFRLRVKFVFSGGPLFLKPAFFIKISDQFHPHLRKPLRETAFFVKGLIGCF